MITLEQIADQERIERIVDWRQTPKWTRAKLRNQPAEGPDTYQWMTRVSAQERRELVQEALLTQRPWSPLVADQVPKVSSWKEARRAAFRGRTDRPNTRQVQHDSRVDHARLFALEEVMAPLVDARLSKNAVAYRPGRSIEDTLCEVLGQVRDPRHGFKFSATIDIRTAYDDVPWDLLDLALQRHLGKSVSDEVLGLVRGSYRAPVVDRRGKHIKRTKGIPQGNVLGPMLLNLYLADLDRVLSRSLANLGASCWRYCDDFLVVAQTEHGLQEAIGLVERELQRLRLAVKEGTRRTRSLQNAQNPALWLGYCFTLRRTWVPRERIEKKAAELVHELVRGRMSPAALEATLEAIETHHQQIIHPDDAHRAVQAIRKLIRPLTDQLHAHKEDDPLNNIRKQLLKKPSATWSQPARGRGPEQCQITLRVVEPTSKGKAKVSSSEDPYTPPGGSRLEPPRTQPNCGGSALSDGHHGAALPQEEEGDHLLPLLSSSNTGSSLAAPALHRRSVPTHSDQAAHPSGAIGNTTCTVDVTARRPGVANVRVTTDAGTVLRSVRIRRPRLHSIEETLLHGYRTALRHLVPVSIVLEFRHPTLIGQLRDGHRVRSPALMHAWELLVKEIAAHAAPGAAISVRMVDDCKSGLSGQGAFQARPPP